MNLQSIIPWKKEERSLGGGRGHGDPFAQLQRRIAGAVVDIAAAKNGIGRLV